MPILVLLGKNDIDCDDGTTIDGDEFKQYPNGRYYTLAHHNDDKDYDEAVAKCSGEGGATLVTLETKANYDAVQQFARKCYLLFCYLKLARVFWPKIQCM